MKSLKRILAVIAATASVFAFAGCSEEDADALLGPENTWCTMPVTYTSDDGTKSTTLNVSFYYASKDVTPTGASAGLRSDIEKIPEGSLSVLVTLCNGTNTYLTTLLNTQYLFKSFGSVDDINTTSETTFSYSSMRLLWTAIYLKNYTALNADKSTSIPGHLQQGTSATYTNVAEAELSDFSWKKMLSAYLLNSL